MREHEMDCQEVRDQLAAYLEGEVTPENKISTEAHLSSCSPCRAELEALSATQKELRLMLRTMAEEVSPPVQVWEKVQVRLSKENNWFGSLHNLYRAKTWQMASAASVVIIIAIAVIFWQFGGSGNMQPPVFSPASSSSPAPLLTLSPVPASVSASIPVVAPTPPRPAPIHIEVNAGTTRSTFLRGEDIELSFLITNMTSEQISVAPFPPQVAIKRIDPFELKRVIPAGEETRSLEIGEAIICTIKWDQKDNDGQPASAGTYLVEVTDLKVSGTTPQAQISSYSITRIFIQSPLGALEKTIEVNQDQTINGVTVTLKKVEIYTSGIKVYASSIPMDYSFMKLSPEAVYLIDGEPIRQDGLLEVRVKAVPDPWPLYQNHMYYSWDFYPVSGDSTELVFIINRIGNHEGPWNFIVPLDD